MCHRQPRSMQRAERRKDVVKGKRNLAAMLLGPVMSAHWFCSRSADR